MDEIKVGDVGTIVMFDRDETVTVIGIHKNSIYVEDRRYCRLFFPKDQFKKLGDFSIRCIIKGCRNHKHEGRFVNDLCSPCYEYLTEGKGEYSQAYRNDIAKFNEGKEFAVKKCAEWVKQRTTSSYLEEELQRYLKGK
jgi:hypothetical protein